LGQIASAFGAEKSEMANTKELEKNVPQNKLLQFSIYKAPDGFNTNQSYNAFNNIRDDFWWLLWVVIRELIIVLFILEERTALLLLVPLTEKKLQRLQVSFSFKC
jgi:hypothetical protein